MYLYECLGVPRDADAAAIHRAYRSAAKDAHPDAGGSEKAFAAVKHARDVLIDPNRRARYDQTGEAEDTAPDNAVSSAMQFVSAALDAAMGQIEAEGREAHQTHDLPTRMLRVLVAQKTKVSETVRNLERAAQVNERLLGRFTVIEGESRIDALIRGRIGAARNMIEGHKRGHAALDDAIAIVEAHKFRADQGPPVERQMFAFATMMDPGRWSP